MDRAAQDITRLLKVVGQDANAADQCLSLVYDELRAIAQRQLSAQRPGHTLQTTALVHEVYLKLSRAGLTDVSDRGHFFALAARAMRQILVDHARTKRRLKRGGADAQRAPLDAVVEAYEERVGDLEALQEAMAELRQNDETKATIIDLRFFTQLSMTQIAETMDLPLRSVERQWALARAWLKCALEDRGGTLGE